MSLFKGQGKFHRNKVQTENRHCASISVGDVRLRPGPDEISHNLASNFAALRPASYEGSHELQVPARFSNMKPMKSIQVRPAQRVTLGTLHGSVSAVTAPLLSLEPFSESALRDLHTASKFVDRED